MFTSSPLSFNLLHLICTLVTKSAREGLTKENIYNQLDSTKLVNDSKGFCTLLLGHK